MTESPEAGPPVFLVVCRDRPNTAEVRRAALPAHRDHVDAHAHLIAMSGPLLADADTASPPTPDARRIGQMYVLRAERADVDTFLATDPFTRANLFAAIDVHRVAPKFESFARRHPSAG